MSSSPVVDNLFGVDVDWILEYQKMLESQCPPDWDEHTRNFMLLTAPAMAIRNRCAPIIEEQAAEIARLKVKIKKLEGELALANLDSVSTFLGWVEQDEAARLRLFATERAKLRAETSAT